MSLRSENRNKSNLQSVRALRRISCHGRNYSQPYFFKRNQSSDNRIHCFGAKFLLKKLSASDFSYERKSAFRVAHCVCSDNGLRKGIWRLGHKGKYDLNCVCTVSELSCLM